MCLTVDLALPVPEVNAQKLQMLEYVQQVVD